MFGYVRISGWLALGYRILSFFTFYYPKIEVFLLSQNWRGPNYTHNHHDSIFFFSFKNLLLPRHTHKKAFLELRIFVQVFYRRGRRRRRRKVSTLRARSFESGRKETMVPYFQPPRRDRTFFQGQLLRQGPFAHDIQNLPTQNFYINL